MGVDYACACYGGRKKLRNKILDHLGLSFL